MFGNHEVQFHEKPIRYRGVTRQEAEKNQHYPGYRHPLEFTNTDPSLKASAAGNSDSKAHGGSNCNLNTHNAKNPSYMDDCVRLDKQITPDDQLRYERQQERSKKEKRLAARREVNTAKEQARQQQREEEYNTSAREAEARAGVSRKNQQTVNIFDNYGGRAAPAHTSSNQPNNSTNRNNDSYDIYNGNKVDVQFSRQKDSYERRQDRLDQKNRSTNYNIITGQPL